MQYVFEKAINWMWVFLYVEIMINIKESEWVFVVYCICVALWISKSWYIFSCTVVYILHVGMEEMALAQDMSCKELTTDGAEQFKRTTLS